MIFKAVGDSRPYPDHGLESTKDWSNVPPRVVQLGELITTKSTLDLRNLLADDSTFYGDLFPHAVQWKGELYLEDGLHRCLRAALQQRTAVHVRVLNLDEIGGMNGGDPSATRQDKPAPAVADGKPRRAADPVTTPAPGASTSASASTRTDAATRAEAATDAADTDPTGAADTEDADAKATDAKATDAEPAGDEPANTGEIPEDKPAPST